MHMADAMINTPVALGAGVLATTLLGIAGYKINKEKTNDSKIVPLMGVLGAFVFAAQMINFTIPGSGSSGHIIGGVLLAAFLGPWAAFLTLSSVLIIQCLIFADGGLLALGCNILNMSAMSTLIAYPLIFKPLTRSDISSGRLIFASVLSCLVGIELGACAVTIETEFSGITALSTTSFLALMTGIHLAIGIGEGLATGAILAFVVKSRPDLIISTVNRKQTTSKSYRKVILGFAIATVVLGGGLAFIASEKPDGLEWSILQLTGDTEIEANNEDSISVKASEIRSATSVMPEYDNSLSGILGALMVVILIWSLTSLLTAGRHRIAQHSSSKKQ